MTNIYDPEPHTLPLLRACEAAPEMAPFFGVNLGYLPQIGTVARTAPKRPRSSKGVRRSSYYSRETKLKAIARTDAGESLAEVSERMGIPINTIKTWRRSRGTR